MKFKVDTFLTKDSKRIYYYIFGDTKATPIFFFHGYPGTGKQAMLLRDSHLQDEFYLISIDRPGYGLSDPQPGLTLKKFADDVCALADFLGIEKFICMGVSGGGPFVASVAYYYPERVLKVGSICGVAPVTPGNLVYLNNKQKKTYFLKKFLPRRVMNFFVNKAFSELLAELNNIMSSDLLSSKDKVVFQHPEIGPFFVDSFKEALAKGPAGILTDMEILTNPWGFELSDIKVPYHLWHGDEDDIVHYKMSYYMNRKLRDVKLNIYRGEGHYSLPYNYKNKVLEDLLKSEDRTI